MSYGRSPYYVYQGEYDNGKSYFCFMDQAASCEEGDGQRWASIEYDAMAQFVASMWRRDHDLEQLGDLHGELRDLVARGLDVRPDLRDPMWGAAYTIKPSEATPDD